MAGYPYSYFLHTEAPADTSGVDVVGGKFWGMNLDLLLYVQESLGYVSKFSSSSIYGHMHRWARLWQFPAS